MGDTSTTALQGRTPGRYVGMRNGKDRTKWTAHTRVGPLDWSNSAPCDGSSLALTCDAIARASQASFFSLLLLFDIVKKEKRKGRGEGGGGEALGFETVVLVSCHGGLFLLPLYTWFPFFSTPHPPPPFFFFFFFLNNVTLNVRETQLGCFLFYLELITIQWTS